MCVFNRVYAFGTRFQSHFFARNDISWRVRKPNAKHNSFQMVTIFFYFFLQHISYTLCHLCSRRFWQSTFSTDPWLSWADPEGGGGDRESGSPLKNQKNLGFLSNTCPGLLKNYKATKPAFNVGPLSARQQNAI